MACGHFPPDFCIIPLLPCNIMGILCCCLIHWLPRKALITFHMSFMKEARGRRSELCITDEGTRQTGSGVLASPAVTPNMLHPHMPLHCSASSVWVLVQVISRLRSYLYLSPFCPTWHSLQPPSSMNSSLSPSAHELLQTTFTAESTVLPLIPVFGWDYMIRFIHVSSDKTVSSFRAEIMSSEFL